MRRTSLLPWILQRIKRPVTGVCTHLHLCRTPRTGVWKNSRILPQRTDSTWWWFTWTASPPSLDGDCWPWYFSVLTTSSLLISFVDFSSYSCSVNTVVSWVCGPLSIPHPFFGVGKIPVSLCAIYHMLVLDPQVAMLYYGLSPQFQSDHHRYIHLSSLALPFPEGTYVAGSSWDCAGGAGSDVRLQKLLPLGISTNMTQMGVVGAFWELLFHVSDSRVSCCPQSSGVVGFSWSLSVTSLLKVWISCW